MSDRHYKNENVISWSDFEDENTIIKEPITDKPTINAPKKTSTSETGSTGLERLDIGAERIEVDDKKIINCRADLNQLVPFKYAWA